MVPLIHMVSEFEEFELVAGNSFGIFMKRSFSDVGEFNDKQFESKVTD